jgi:flagellar protein FlaF
MTVTPLRRANDAPLPPAIDIDSFRRVTAALTRCASEAAPEAAGDATALADRRSRLARAIHANMTLWGSVLHEVLDGTAAVPHPLRDHLAELAEVSIRHCSYVLRGDAAVDPLIAVNRSIIDGLQPGAGRRAAVADR